MDLKLYNTLTHRKEVFKPLDPKNVRMYVCGPTVYDYAHIGNARPVIVFDVLFRLLRHIYGEDHVTYVRNITDVDDKIIAAAKEDGVSIKALTARTIKTFHEDIKALGVLMPEDVNPPGANASRLAEPRATQHIPEMIAMIERLIATGHAYEAEGHVLFDVASKADYGKLAHRSTDEMIAGARVEVAPYKKHPMDFVLWKPSADDQPGWPSPWGRGRPGWHVECSAMAEALLGETFDIHGGGIDLVFPHHENEIAQSESAHKGAPLANVWMHNGFLEVEGAKMSKSLGNFVTIQELIRCLDGHGLPIRYNMLRTHYTQPFDWTESGMNQSINELNELWLVASDYNPSEVDGDFLSHLRDDLNTHLARTRLIALKDAARHGNNDDGRKLRATLEWYGFSELFVPRELILPDPLPDDAAEQLSSIAQDQHGDVTVRELIDWLKSAVENGSVDKSTFTPLFWSMLGAISPASRMRAIRHIDRFEHRMIYDKRQARLVARKAKNFAEADRIRKELEEKGILLKDTPEGTTWELKR